MSFSDLGGPHSCEACGLLFYRNDVKTQIPEDEALRRVSDSKERFVAMYCEECRRLSHFDRQQLYQLNRAASQKPHGYWREWQGLLDRMDKLIKAVDSLPEQISEKSG